MRTLRVCPEPVRTLRALSDLRSLCGRLSHQGLGAYPKQKWRQPFQVKRWLLPPMRQEDLKWRFSFKKEEAFLTEYKPLSGNHERRSKKCLHLPKDHEHLAREFEGLPGDCDHRLMDGDPLLGDCDHFHGKCEHPSTKQQHFSGKCEQILKKCSASAGSAGIP